MNTIKMILVKVETLENKILVAVDTGWPKAADCQLRFWT